MLKVKSKGEVKNLLDDSFSEKKSFSGTNTNVFHSAGWSKVSVNNQNVNFQNDGWLEVGKLPVQCNHTDYYLGLYPVLTKAWMPTNIIAFAKVENNKIFAKTSSTCNGTLYFEWITNKLEIVGGGLKFIQKFRTLFERFSLSVRDSRKEGSLC